MAASTDITLCEYYVVYGTKVFNNINTQSTTQITLCTMDEIRQWFNHPNVSINNIDVIVNNCDANNVNIRPYYTAVIKRNESVTINLAFHSSISVPGGTQYQAYRVNFGIFWYPIEDWYSVI